MKQFLSVLSLSILCQSIAFSQKGGLKVLLQDKINVENSIIFSTESDKSGNTSVAFDAEDIHKWSGKSVVRAEGFGYFDEKGEEISYIKRDRDLGQTFRYTDTQNKKLKSITVQLGFGTNVVRPAMYGKNLSIQIFEVSGKAILNKNNSNGIEAFHGFPHDRNGDSIPDLRDDYFTGEIFKSLGVFGGATFPPKSAFGFEQTDEISPDHSNLKGKYLKFVLPKKYHIVLKKGKTYAFLILIDEIGKNQGFTLANSYIGSYPDGHGIRRDGNGIFPPTMSNPMKNFTDVENRQAMRSAHFPTDFKKRIQIPPATNGYPDVCTWRDLVFFIEAEKGN
jgi:hypothetical protein